MKKRIKNKHLPKFDLSGDLSSINRAKSATATVTGPTVPLANGLTQQASDNLSFDSGLSSTPNFGMSTKTGNIIGGVGRVIGAMSSFIPEDNDDHGVSRTGQKISSGIQKGMDTAGEAASSFGPVGQVVGGVLKAGSFLVKGFTALADAVKERKNPKDEKWDKQYNAINPNSSTLNFGIPQGKFGLPLYPNGGNPKPIYTSDINDPRLKSYNDSLSLYKAMIKQDELMGPNYNNENTQRQNKPALRDWNQKQLKENRIVKYMPKYGIYSAIDFKSEKDQFKEPGYYWNRPEDKKLIQYYKSLGFTDNNIMYHSSPDLVNDKIKPIDSYHDGTDWSPVYKKPIQPVIYQKEVGVPVPKKNIKGFLKENNEIDILKGFVSQEQPQEGIETKGQSLPDYLIQNVKTINGNKTYKRKDRNSPWQEQGFALGGVPYNQADIEAEQGEAILGPNNSIQNIEGQKHEQGGTPLSLNGKEQYIYSDRLGYDENGFPTININNVEKTFADKAKSIERKYSKKKDPLAEKTKELELSKLTQDAEQTRQLKEQVDMSKDVKRIQAKYGKDLRKFANSGAPNELSGDAYSQWSNLFYNNSGMYPDANMYAGLTNQPNMNTGIGMFQNWVKDRDKTMLPKYGIDGKWGPESQNAWTKYGAEYSKLISDSPSKGIGITNTPTAGTTINAPLFTGNLPSGPQQDMNGIDIEKPGDDFGAGIGVYGKQPSTGRNGLFKNLTQGDKLQLAGILQGTLYNLGMGLKKAEKEKFYTNPYQNEIVRLMQNRRFDAQHFINEATMANQANNQNISDNASSVGVKLANMQKAQANYINSLASITGKAQEINNNYRAEEAQVKNNLGEVLRQEGIRQAGVNAQNKAAKQAFMAKAMTQLGQGIAAVGQASNQSLTNTILAKSLSELSPDFDVKKLKDLYDRGQVDESGYFTFNGSKYQYIPSQTGRAEDGQVVKVTQDLGLPINKKTLYPPMTFTTTTTKKGK